MTDTQTPNSLLFDVTQVALKGKNLIEASAGTGKTYSLAMLSLRFIVEQNIPIRQLLLVTFTEKAVAELQVRVRQFIRSAHAYAQNTNQPTDPTIKKLVDQSSCAKENLAQAIYELDELNIYTIHSFCQQTLSEFAFQTGEAFNKELLPDLSDYVNRFVHVFIRENLYPLSQEEISDLMAVFSSLFDIKHYATALREGKLTTIQNFDQLIAYYNANFDDVKLLQKIEAFASNPAFKFVYDLFYKLSNDERLHTIIERENVLTFDDLILNLNKAITPELVAIIANKYRVLFIDEFQDTDTIQYELFSKLFVSQTIFYIGDPKQSIYKFRNADIHSYFKAKQDVNAIYNLPTNYRSTIGLVKAVNELFDDNRFTSQLNAFCFPKSNALIQHHSINANNTETAYLTYNDDVINTPMYINNYIDEESIADNILSFLTLAKHKNTQIEPNQIAFIARTNDALLSMKKALAERKIPAVIIQEQLIFNTEEAEFVLRILYAIQSRSTKAIRYVLSHRLFDISITLLAQLEFTDYINYFFDYYNEVYKKGIYNVLMDVYARFNIETNIHKHLKNDVQFWANVMQITEQLQHIQTQDKLTLEGLIAKLEYQNVNDETIYQTRIESDDKAIQLLTIHKAKGLEFDYVFTSNLNKGKSTSVTGFFKYYDPNTEKYITDLSLSNIGYYNPAYQLSEEQEMRRVLYVILTRAKYGVFCYSKETKRPGSFTHFMAKYQSDTIGTEFPFIELKSRYKAKQTKEITLHNAKLDIVDKDWKKLSYSYLSGPYSHYVANQTEVEHTDYDNFIFSTLQKGITTGNLIHHILERVDFTEYSQWNAIIKRSIVKYAPTKLAEYTTYIPQLITQVMEATIQIGEDNFTLSQIGNTQKSTELEFDFHVDRLDLDRLAHLENKTVQLKHFTPEMTYNGVFNGLIDLVFEHNGKYYIADWKTNYLGNSLSDYTSDTLQQAMTANNYHLQYCIYSIALTKYLKTKITNFDYETHFGGVIYIFARGVRANQKTGVYTNRLSLHDIQLLDSIFC